MKPASWMVLLFAVLVTQALAGDPGIVWPGKERWPKPGDALFVGASDLTVLVARDELRLVPADQLRCDNGADECIYTFRPCEMVWAKKSDQKVGYVVIEVAQLRGSTFVGGRWWDLLIASEAACRNELDSKLTIEAWNGPGRLKRRGWTVSR